MLKFCCCGMRLREGARAIGITSIIAGVLLLVPWIAGIVIGVKEFSTVKRLILENKNIKASNGTNDDQDFTPQIFDTTNKMILASIILLTLLIMASITSGSLLVIATLKNNRSKFVLTWLITTAIGILCAIGYGITYLAVFSRHPYASVIICGGVAVFFPSLGLTGYFWLVVRSYYEEMPVIILNEDMGLIKKP